MKRLTIRWILVWAKDSDGTLHGPLIRFPIPWLR